MLPSRNRYNAEMELAAYSKIDDPRVSKLDVHKIISFSFLINSFYKFMDPLSNVQAPKLSEGV